MPPGFVKLGEAASFSPLRPGNPVAEPIRRHARLMIVEDTQMLLELYLERLGRLKDVDVCNRGVVETADDALLLFSAHRPDIVVTDLSLTQGGTEGFDILRRIKERSPGTPVILTSTVYRPENTDELSLEIKAARFDAAFNKFDFDHLLWHLERVAREIH